MTTENRKVQLKAELDATGARQGFEEVKQGARDMAQAVGQAGAQASKGMDGIGTGANAGAQQVDRATRSIIGSIERTTAALNAGGKAGSEYYELLARQRGVSVDALRPYLDQLRQAEAAQKVATGSLGKMEVSAKQTAAALRGVPAQFTDIITSLQGGQAPLTVLLQQGGQLRDMFGSTGAAARALGGFVLGLVNPMTVAAAAAGTLAVAYNQGSKEADGYRRAIVLTGNAAGTTTGQLTEYARAIDAVVGTQGKAAETIAAFVSTGRVQSQMLEQFSTAAIRFERTTGQAVGETAKQFADLRNAPLDAILKLNEGMNFLTRSTYNQIKALEDQGRITEAAAVAQSAYADALTSRAGEMEANLGTIERGWLAVKDAAKEAWDAILNVGRRGTQGDALAGLESNLARVQRELAGGGFSETAGGAVTGRPMDARRRAQLQAEEMALQEQVKLLRQSITLSEERAAAEAKAAEQIRARAAWDKEGLKYLDDRARLEREINAERERGLAAGASQAEIEARIAAIRERNTKAAPRETRVSTGGESELARIKALVEAQRERNRRLQEYGDLAEKMTPGEELRLRIQQDLATSIAGVARERKLQALAAAEELIAEEKVGRARDLSIAAQKEQARIAADAARAYGQWIGALERSADAAAESAQSMRDEEAAAAIASEGYYSLAQAVQLVEIARLQERKAVLDTNEPAALAIQREIDKRRELVGLIGNKEARETAAQSLKETEQQAVRMLQSIDDAGREAFLAIGRDGVDAFERIGDSIKASVLDVLYQLTLRPYIIQVAAQVTGAPQSAVQQLTGGGSGGLGGGTGLFGGLTGFSGWGTGIAGPLSNLGAGFGIGASGGLFGGGLSTGISLMQSGATMGGMGAIAGAVMPWVTAIGAIASLFGNRNKWSGSFGETQVRGGTAGEVDARSVFTNSSYSAELSKTTAQVGESIAKTVEAFGGATSDFILRQFSATASKKDRAQAGTDLFIGGQFVRVGQTEVSKNDQAAAFAEQAQRATLVALQRSIGGALGDYFDSIDALTADITDVQEVLQTASSVRAFGEQAMWLGGVFDDLASLGVRTTADLATAAGGFDSLAQSSAQAYQLLYTEQERLAFLSEDVAAAFSRLGQEVPATAGQYIAALNDARQAMQNGVSGADELYATLLKLAPAWDTVSRAAGSAMSAILSRLQEQGRSLEVDLLRSQGRDVEALALQRQIETEGYTEAERAAYDYVQGLRDQIDAQNEANRAAEEAARAAEVMAERMAAMTAEADAARVELFRSQGRDVEADALQFSIDTAGMGAAELAIYRFTKAIQAQTAANEEAAAAAAQAAASVQEAEAARAEAQRQAEIAAIEAQRNAARAAFDAAREQVAELETLGRLLGESVRSIYSEVFSTLQAQASEGRDFISRSLATAIATGYLPDAEQLSQAIDAARAGIQATPFASRADADFERLVLAGQLAAIDEITAGKKSTAELQLEVAERQLRKLEQIREALGASAPAPSSTSGGSTASPQPEPARPARPDISGITPTAAYLSANPDVARAYSQNTYGLTLNEFVRQHYERFGRTEGRLSPEEELRRLGIGSFAVGTDYVPHDMLAMVHQGETITPRQFTDEQGRAMRQMLAELVEMRRILDDVLTHQRATASNTADTYRVVSGQRQGAPLLVRTVSQ